MIAPYPISTAIIGNIDGKVLRYMFVDDGCITKAIIWMNEKPKVPVAVDILIENKYGGVTKSYLVHKQSFEVTLDLSIFSGDRLTVSVKSDHENDVDELWIAFKWVVDVKDAEVKKVLIDELENNLEAINERI